VARPKVLSKISSAKLSAFILWHQNELVHTAVLKNIRTPLHNFSCFAGFARGEGIKNNMRLFEI